MEVACVSHTCCMIPYTHCVAEEHTAALTLQICRAMAYTVSSAEFPVALNVADDQHAKSITHRDLKPEVRHLSLGTMNGADLIEHPLDEGNTRLPRTNQDCRFWSRQNG